MVGWHHRLNGHESEQTPGDGEGHGRLVCCNPWGHKVSDTTERLDNNMRFQSRNLPRSWHLQASLGPRLWAGSPSALLAVGRRSRFFATGTFPWAAWVSSWHGCWSFLEWVNQHVFWPHLGSHRLSPWLILMQWRESLGRELNSISLKQFVDKAHTTKSCKRTLKVTLYPGLSNCISEPVTKAKPWKGLFLSHPTLEAAPVALVKRGSWVMASWKLHQVAMGFDWNCICGVMEMLLTIFRKENQYGKSWSLRLFWLYYIQKSIYISIQIYLKSTYSIQNNIYCIYIIQKSIYILNIIIQKSDTYSS